MVCFHMPYHIMTETAMCHDYFWGKDRTIHLFVLHEAHRPYMYGEKRGYVTYSTD